MSEEKKHYELTEEDLKKITGGDAGTDSSDSFRCPACGGTVNMSPDRLAEMVKFVCPNCSTTFDLDKSSKRDKKIKIRIR